MFSLLTQVSKTHFTVVVTRSLTAAVGGMKMNSYCDFRHCKGLGEKRN